MAEPAAEPSKKRLSHRLAADARRPVETWTKARAILFLRLTLVIATAYLLLAQSESLSFANATTTGLILAALASNVPFFWLSRELIESTGFSAFLILFDTLWISFVLVGSGYLDVDFYVVYFFVLFLAAVSENLKLMSLGTVLVSVSYLYSVFATEGPAQAWSSPTLIRLPFFFAVAALYGYLADRVRREHQAGLRLLQMARCDPLTNLPNRRTLEERMERAISSAYRTGHRVALLLFDLDGFKYVNDTHGHAVGDELLIAIADRLQHSVRMIDLLGRFGKEELHTASRLGGDEFAVVLTALKDVDGVAKVAQRLVAMISEPVQIGDLEIAVSASLGISVFNGEQKNSLLREDAHSLATAQQQLLIQADRALYSAKEEGRNAVKFYDVAMDREIRTRIALSRELQDVLERGELFLEYQPQVELARRTIIGAEALLRWRHPERGLISPNEFIHIAESSGQIDRMGEWILQAACHEAVGWKKIHPPGIPIAINLSAVQFRNPELPDMIARILEQEGLPPQLLELELTESVLLRATTGVEQSLRKLHDEMAVRISLDDFGRGFSSLEYLRRFPIDKLKVDRFFVSSIEEDADSGAIASAIIALARRLRLVVIAEGVETEGQLEFLQAEDCELAQGYYFSRPVSSSGFERLLIEGGEHLRPTVGADPAAGQPGSDSG